MTQPKSKLLLVDDDPDLLRLLSMRLSAAGYQTVAVSSGKEALARLEIERPLAVITDLRMEGIDGLALFDSIQQRSPALPVIILTAHGTIQEAVAATKRGLFAFLAKPFDGAELLEHIEQAIKLAGANATPDVDTDATWRSEIVTRSPLMEELLSQAKLVAHSDASVLIRGPSGAGKELLAKAIAKGSGRRDEAFVAFNCAAIPDSLLESELFGYCKGAFTGALKDHPGLFQVAHRGTLFLDEIGDMPLALQAKLLRVLQEKQVRPVGSTRTVTTDVRIISATHCDLEAAVSDGRFRSDLYYRLDVVTLQIPALEQRREDIPLLANHFLAQLAAGGKRTVQGFTSDAMELLVSAAWPGNVRQLTNVVEQTFAMCTTQLIPLTLVQNALREQPAEFPSFDQARMGFEREYLARLLKITNGNVSQAARLASRGRTDFYKLLRRHRLDPALFKADKG